MKVINSLDQLFIQQLRSLYSAERQLLKTVPRFIDRTESETLKDVLVEYEARAQTRMAQLEKAFALVAVSEFGGDSEVTEELIAETTTLLHFIVRNSVRDAAIIAEMQRICHLLIADYGTACAFAQGLKLQLLVDLLKPAIEVIKQMDQALSKIAYEVVNPNAVGIAT